MKPDREQLLKIKNGPNHYDQFQREGFYDGWSESIFSHIKETVDLLINQIDKGDLPETMHAFLRKRFLKAGWDKFLYHMEYVRPNDPENRLHDEVNKLYYDQMAFAIGLNNFQDYLKKPTKSLSASLKAHKQELTKLDELAEFHGKKKVNKIKQIFTKHLNEINKSNEPVLDKTRVLSHFEKLLQEITDMDIYDTDDREIIADIVEDCLINFGFDDSDGLLEKYL